MSVLVSNLASKLISVQSAETIYSCSISRAEKGGVKHMGTLGWLKIDQFRASKYTGIHLSEQPLFGVECCQLEAVISVFGSNLASPSARNGGFAA